MTDNERPRFNLYEFRASGFTDRDAPTLYGLTPERTLGSLFEDKVGMSDPCKEPFGSNLFEVPARTLFRDQYFGPKPLRLDSVFVRHAAMPFFRAEIDGACYEESLLVRVVQLTPEEFARLEDGSLPIYKEAEIPEGRVSRRHWVEIQHQLIASGIRKAYFVGTVDGGTIAFARVERDDVFASNHVAEVIQFLDHVRRGVYPPGAEPTPEPEEITEPSDNPTPELPGINPPNEGEKNERSE